MVLTNFYTVKGGRISFTRDQASRFAKEIANDFNPLHDTDAKMFCVPGDLMFSVVLDRLGLSRQMQIEFSGMVNDNDVIFPESGSPTIDVVDDEGKRYLTIHREGELTRDQTLIDNLSRSYVAFSGKTFPDILVPLMARQGVMINPARPLIMYKSMEISLDRLDLRQPNLESTGASLDVQGKKGTVRLDFRFLEEGEEVGRGAKYMALRGLRTYQAETMQRVVDEYNRYKQAYNYQSSLAS
ncbi:MAG: DUF3581 domain-containing protein [Candidatus Thiodiazotropha sp. (ex Dulcina madagascariensis)]|nr:DUF3581 domain-containing protein [Candidatus Thiodiazotropha sp. (ex Epidulcina cf. delphinae)]MCU7923482.1 DUF3581 domain-containing protein [Candidatus Thiodiazotropha sp. (ex Dulcina madagascariensis)]MCU7926602.1 DUF3581 domain-containing protein [Candidatus Thiodiazotropha sp. (ex Dulcina madagascariensis)]